MSRTQKRCLIASSGVHAVLVITVFVLPGVLASRRPDPVILPPMELVDTRGIELRSQAGGGGGRPIQRQSPPVARQPQRQQPPKPVEQPQPRQQPQPRETPAPKAEPEPKKVVPPVTPPKVIAKAEVVPPKKPTPTPKSTPVAVSREVRRLDSDDRRARQEAERRREADARAAAEAARRDALLRELRGLRSQVAGNLSGATEITVPGPGGGGRVWLGYAEYLKAFYEARWVRPQSLSRPVAYVGVEITVTKSGMLKGFKVMEESGVPELDHSVEEVMRRHRNLEPLPTDFDGIERTFRIKFRLEGTAT